MPPKDKDGKDNKPVVKGKGNLMKVPTKGELDKDASILAMRWIWSYEKDEMQTELFGLDDQWTKKIFFDRVKLTAEEQREYPDRKKPPPWIDTGAGKPKKVHMATCGVEVCQNGGWMEEPLARPKADAGPVTFRGASKKIARSLRVLAASQPVAKQGSLRLDAAPTEQSPASVWAAYRHQIVPPVIYGRVIPAKEIRKSSHDEKFNKWLAKLREPAERAAAEAKAAEEEAARKAAEEQEEALARAAGKKKGQQKTSQEIEQERIKKEAEKKAEAEAEERKKKFAPTTGSYWIDRAPVENNPFVPPGGDVSAGRKLHQVEHDIQQDLCQSAFDKIKEQTRHRAKMNPADREKRKLALLEPMWQDFERLHMPITSVLPSRIDRWGIEYDARWLPSARSKGFRQLRLDFTDIWRDDELEELVMPYNGCEGMAVTIAKAFAYHPLYSKYLDKTGVLVRKDEDFECWWADFERPIETLQKIKEKRQKEAEEREEQEAIERGEKKPRRKHREDSDSDTEAQELPAAQVASGPSIEAASTKDQSGGVDQFPRGLSVGGVKMGAGRGKATGSNRLPAKVALKNRLAEAKAKAQNKAKGLPVTTLIDQPSEELFCCGHNGFFILAFAERDDAEEGHLRKGNDDGMDADDDTVVVSREQVALMKAQKSSAERKQSQAQALTERLAALRRDCKLITPRVEEKKGRESPLASPLPRPRPPPPSQVGRSVTFAASAEHLDKSPGLKHAASVTPYVKSLLEDEEDVDD